MERFFKIFDKEIKFVINNDKVYCPYCYCENIKLTEWRNKNLSVMSFCLMEFECRNCGYINLKAMKKVVF